MTTATLVLMLVTELRHHARKMVKCFDEAHYGPEKQITITTPHPFSACDYRILVIPVQN